MRTIDEECDDRQRGLHPRVLRAVAAVRDLNIAHRRCDRCRLRRATRLVDNLRRAVCPGCADAWNRLSPLERKRALLTGAMR